MKHLVGILVVLSVMGCDPAVATHPDRVPNSGIAKRVAGIRTLKPREVVLTYYVGHLPGKGVSPPNPPPISITKPREIEEIFDVLSRSTHAKGQAEPAAVGKDNMVDIMIPHDSAKTWDHITVMMSGLETGWGPEVKALILKRLPSRLKLTDDLRIVAARD